MSILVDAVFLVYSVLFFSWVGYNISYDTEDGEKVNGDRPKMCYVICVVLYAIYKCLAGNVFFDVFCSAVFCVNTVYILKRFLDLRRLGI